MGDIIDIDWSRELAEQLDWHWREQPRPRPDGLTADFAGLARPCGPAEPFPDAPMASLVLHINREVIHHGAEVALLRDLCRWRFGGVAAPGAGG